MNDHGVHHGEGPGGGEEPAELLKGQAGDDQEPRGPHQEAAPERRLGEGGQEGVVVAQDDHVHAPRQFTHLRRVSLRSFVIPLS